MFSPTQLGKVEQGVRRLTPFVLPESSGFLLDLSQQADTCTSERTLA